MKIFIKTLFIMLLLSMANSIHAQGSDIIFIIDNSGSVDTNEYNGLKQSIDSIIANVLNCNPNNRVAVTHYGTRIIDGLNPNFFPKIYIESDFTNDIAVAQNFQRRLAYGDYLHESTQLLGDALDGMSNSQIVSPQTQLNMITSNQLVVFIFTDGSRGFGPITPPVSGGGSYLVNAVNPTPNTDAAFQIYTDFKNNRGATFFVIHESPNNVSQNAAASIASLGGSYNGPLETYPADPDNGNVPRYYYPVGATQDFVLTTTQIDEISSDLCLVNPPSCVDTNFTNNINYPIDHIISWDDTATNYEIQIIGSSNFCNDPNPNQDPNDPNSVIASFTTDHNFVNFNNIVMTYRTKCFYIRVRPIGCNWTDWCYATSTDFGVICIPSCDNFTPLITLISPDDDINSASGNIDYDTYIDIVASNNIEPNFSSNYIASNSIRILPGFLADNGSYFNAYINPCIAVSPTSSSAFVESYSSYSYDSDNADFESDTVLAKANLNLYPNPTKGKVNIKSAEVIESYTLKNMYGQTVQSSKQILAKTKVELNLEALRPGIYFLSLQLENGEIIIKRVIKE